jgi:O-antigen ligase
MWQFAMRKVGDAPWLGLGKQGWIELRDQGIAKGELVPYIANFSHVHNEYLDVLLKRGVVGLGLLMLLYFGPMFWFFKPYLKATHIEVKTLAIAGMVIPMMYMDFGLTQVFLSHNSGRMVLVSLWMCVAALLLNAVEDNEPHDAVIHRLNELLEIDFPYVKTSMANKPQGQKILDLFGWSSHEASPSKASTPTNLSH